MLPSQRLIFYTASVPQGFKKAVLTWLGVWAGLCIAALFFIPTQCIDTPFVTLPNTSSIGSEPICTPTDDANTLGVYLVVVAIITAVILICAAVGWLFPGRDVSLTVTRRGVISPFSRFPNSVIGWADIESLGVYEEAVPQKSGQCSRYLAVTVHTPDGMHDSNVMEEAWRGYPPIPDMERVAVMVPIERPFDAYGNALTPVQVISRIQTCFPHELAENGVEVFEGARLV